MTDGTLTAWKALTGHLLALLLAIGFFAIVFLALTGYVVLTDPTTANFVGTVTGYAISKLERPLAYYFGVTRATPPPAEAATPTPEVT